MVRERAEADLDDLVRIVAAVEETDGYPPIRPRDLRTFLAGPDALGAWVAEHAGVVVGQVALHAESMPVVMETARRALGADGRDLAVVARLVVDPASRRLGAGRALLEAAAKAAWKLGRRPILDVVTSFEAANALYQSCGWTNLGDVEMAFRMGATIRSYVYLGPADPSWATRDVP